MATVNLSPYTTESEAIARRLRLAEALGQKAAQPLEIPTQAGVKISPLSGLAKMLDEYTAGRQERSAREESKALGEKYQADTSSDFSGLLASLTPKAAVPEGAPTYTPNVDQRDVAENPSMVMQPERNEMGEIIAAGQPGAGNFGVTPGTPAIAATSGELSAEGFKAMKTPAGQQQYMAQLLAQIAPKDAMVVPEGGSLYTKSGKLLVQGAGKNNFGSINPSQYTPESVQAFMSSGGKNYGLLRAQPNLSFQNTGTGIQPFDPRTGLPVGTATPIGVSPNTAASLAQARLLSDREFNGLSANQKAQLGNEAKRLNISAEQLFFDTGLQAGGGARLSPPAPPAPNAPPVVAPPVVPATMPAPVAPVAARPTAAAPMATAPSAVSGLTPKAQQALILEDAQAKAKKERGMSGIGSVIDEARQIMKGEAVDKDGKLIKAPLPTQSYAGAAGNFISGVFGGSPEGAAQADQLKVLGGALLSSMPRMEGPQGEKDVDLYREMAGQVGDNTLSVARRLKALDMVEKLYRKYDTSDVPPPNAVRRIR
jgi:hypothetical protein